MNEKLIFVVMLVVVIGLAYIFNFGNDISNFKEQFSGSPIFQNDYEVR